LLQQARLDLRLAPEDVAQILHLSSKQIIALENDDYKTLSGPTYVRGYLRSYAQLLGLSPEKVVEAYNSLTIAPRPITLPQSAPPPQVTSSDRIVKAATLGVAAILLALVYLWWQSGDESLDRVALAPEAAETLADHGLSPNVADDTDTALATAPAGLPGNGAGRESAPTGRSRRDPDPECRRAGAIAQRSAGGIRHDAQCRPGGSAQAGQRGAGAGRARHDTHATGSGHTSGRSAGAHGRRIMVGRVRSAAMRRSACRA
jgi:hypothetical protein